MAGAPSIGGPQIVFDLTLNIYDISGFVVATLLKRSEKSPSMPLRNNSLQLDIHSTTSQSYELARKHFGNFASIFVKDRLQAVKNISDSFSFCGSSKVLMRMISKARQQLQQKFTPINCHLKTWTKCCFSKIAYLCSELQTFSFVKEYFIRNFRNVS